MRSIPAGEFKQRCLRLLDEVEQSGEPIVVTKRGRPVAEVTPVTSGRNGDWIGSMSDRIQIHGDIVAPAADPDEWEALRD